MQTLPCHFTKQHAHVEQSQAYEWKIISGVEGYKVDDVELVNDQISFGKATTSDCSRCRTLQEGGD